MNTVMNINNYSQTEIITRVTTEELENENIMQNYAQHNLKKNSIWTQVAQQYSPLC
jgi:hypothetical protein